MSDYISDAETEPPTPDELREFDAQDESDRRFELGMYDEVREQLRAEAEAKRGKPYDPLARRLDWARIDAQAANDDAVAAENKRARVAAQRRFDLDTFYRSFLDDEPRAETNWDAIREGRAT